MRRWPMRYILALGALLAVAIVSTLGYLGVPPFDNLGVFIVFSAASFFILLVAGIVGGAFVGMLLAQRLLGNREFSPFERDVLRSLADLRDRLDHLEKRDEEQRLRR